jgi:hypothetical protein
MKGESGTTVVEMIVATFILGTAVAGAAGLISMASSTVASGNHRETATDIGIAELERIRSWPYVEIGIATSADGYEPVFDGSRTVIEPGRNRVEPREISTVDGRDYEIARYVTWATLDVGGDRIEMGYKVVTIGVSWADSSGDHTIWHQSGFFEASNG